MLTRAMAGQEKTANGLGRDVILHTTFQSGKKLDFSGSVVAAELLQKKSQPSETQFLLNSVFDLINDLGSFKNNLIIYIFFISKYIYKSSSR